MKQELDSPTEFDRVAASCWPVEYYMPVMEQTSWVNAGTRNEREYVITSWLLLTNAPG
ncbi:hypothetical protein [Nitrosospira multiformis]|uniref:hypothetical protein n=1 Tax=Nitrosospira multiformis TaxID=1231 RepID=UPI00089D7847|nr:hypothetical protein [Nitrosospira multiformis]SEA30806.1 hypothetical protein SAMN05216411_10711 [Nitrosospira multiformis]